MEVLAARAGGAGHVRRTGLPRAHPPAALAGDERLRRRARKVARGLAKFLGKFGFDTAEKEPCC